MNGKLLKEKAIIGGRYKVLGWLGEGGMQQVFKAEDTLLQRTIALKTPKDSSAEKRFQRSAVVSARVNQDNVAKTLDYFEETDGRAFLVEELIEGYDLAHIAGVIPALPPQAAARILHQLAKGVAASHHAGVVHRDLKPSNVMVVGGIHLDKVKITDFGIAKMAEEEIAQWAEGDKTAASNSKTVMGAVPYMAPECINSFRKAGMPSDVWAIGAITYELLAGSKPFGVGLASVQGILSGNKPKKPAFIVNPEYATLGGEVSSVILSCFEADPKDRPSAQDIVAACGELTYTSDRYYLGHVRAKNNLAFGFLTADEGEVSAVRAYETEQGF